MSVKKKGQYYWYEFEFNGKRYRASTRLKNEAKARQVEAKLRTDLAMGQFGLAAPITSPMAKAYLEGKFLDHIKSRSKDKPNTVNFYVWRIAALLTFQPIATARLSAVDESLIEDYVQFRELAGAAVSTINSELRALSHALNKAIEWKLLNRKPKVRQRPGESHRDFVLSAELETAYLAAASYPIREAVILMLDCGLRVGECVNLRKSDFDATALHVRSGKTPKAKRSIPIPERTKATLDILVKFFPDSEWLFPGRFANHITERTLEQYHGDLRSSQGLSEDFLLHSCRHTFGTRLGESGADPWAVMKLMGHASIKESERYVHPTPEHLVRAMQRKETYDRFVRDGEMDATIKVP